MRLGHPFRDLARFPSGDPGDQQWRIVRRERAATPWWFGHAGGNRFDLHPGSGRGTCYLADDPYGALLETVLRDAEPTGDPGILAPLAPSEVAKLVAVPIRTEHLPTAVADLSGTGDPPPDLHTAYGVTADGLSSIHSYERPQQWAQALAANDHEGVRYRLAHSNGRLGTAVFGDHGRRDWPGGTPEEITIATVTRWRGARSGPELLPAPSDDELDWKDDL